MEYRQLGTTDLSVSQICLGSMTWGEQNTEAEGHAQMDHALDQGINFFDTAEIYAVPPRPETSGRTEEIIGTWFKGRGCRDRIVLATKVVGRNPNVHWIRDGQARLDATNIRAALDGSLKRLRTDYIDLYQLHWPDRPTNRFGALGYTLPDPEDEAAATPLLETLEALDALVHEGKIRHVGISNETPWGTMALLKLAEQHGLTRMVSIQNPYNLLNRTFEVGLAEIAMRERCGLLAYSPLAGGTLTGKYLGGRMPAGSRRALDDRRSRYDTARGEAATEAYVALARRHGLDPAHLAIAYVNAQPFVTSTIIGATTMEQLRTDIDSLSIRLDDDILADIEAIHADNPNPCP